MWLQAEKAKTLVSDAWPLLLRCVCVWLQAEKAKTLVSDAWPLLLRCVCVAAGREGEDVG